MQQLERVHLCKTNNVSLEQIKRRRRLELEIKMKCDLWHDVSGPSHASRDEGENRMPDTQPSRSRQYQRQLPDRASPKPR